MKHLLKISIVGILLLISIQTTYATRIIQDLIIVNNENFALLSYPLDNYLSHEGMTDSDIPWLDKSYFPDSVWNTGLARGYRATWLVENDSLFLVKIENKLSKFPGYLYSIQHNDNKSSIHYDNKYSGDMSNADLRAMFGEKYKNGKVFVDWINEDLFAQYGFIIHAFTLTMRSMEKKIVVENGIVQSITDYSTLTGEGISDVIRIWDGEKINTDHIINDLYKSINEKIKWSEKLSENKHIQIVVAIDNNFSNSILSLKQNKLREMHKTLLNLKKDKENYENKKILNEIDKRNITALKGIITDYETNYLPKVIREAEKEYENDKDYFDELNRIFQALKIESLLYNGEPFSYNNIYLHIHFDTEHKTVTGKGKYWSGY